MALKTVKTAAGVRKANRRGYFVIGVVWPPEMLTKIDALAESEHRSFSAQVVHLCASALKTGVPA